MDLRRETLESLMVWSYLVCHYILICEGCVLFLHGIGENSSMYESEMKLLKERWLFHLLCRFKGAWTILEGPRNLGVI